MTGSGSAAGGGDKYSLEMEMDSVLGGVPELSTISSREPMSLETIKEDTAEFSTKYGPYLLALGLVLLLVGGAAVYTTSLKHDMPQQPSTLPHALPNIGALEASLSRHIMQMSRLHTLKASALDSEDYDAAKKIKGEIDTLTAKIEAAKIEILNAKKVTAAPTAVTTTAVAAVDPDACSKCHKAKTPHGYSCIQRVEKYLNDANNKLTKKQVYTTVANEGHHGTACAICDQCDPDACSKCHKAKTPHGYSCIQRIEKYLNGANNKLTNKQVYTTVANEEHHGTACAICDQCDPPEAIAAPTTPPTQTQLATASTAPTAAPNKSPAETPATAKPTPFTTSATTVKREEAKSAFDPTDCTAKNGGHPSCACPKLENEDYHWTFYDDKTRPTAPYGEHANRDVPDDAWADGTWQSDAVYVNHFIDAAEKLVERAMKAIYEEYGQKDGSKMFDTVKIQLSDGELLALPLLLSLPLKLTLQVSQLKQQV